MSFGFGIGPIGGGGGVSVRNVSVPAGATGRVVNLVRLLGSASTFSLVSGTNANITLNNGDGLALGTGLAAGASQVAQVREQVGSGATARAVEYAVNCTGATIAPAAPTVALTAGNGQISVAWTDGSNGGSAITSHPIYVNGVKIAEPTGASPYVITGLTNGTSYSVRVSAVNAVGESPLSSVQSATPISFSLPAPSLAKINGDSRGASSGGRQVIGGNSISVRHGTGGYTMAGFIQALCGNKWLLGEGYQNAIGGSSTVAQLERDKTTSIATTGNPAPTTIGTGFSANDGQYSANSDGLATCITQTGNHIFSASVSVNDTAAYYNTPNDAYQTLRVIAQIADAYGAAGKVWYLGNEFPRGDSCYQMESKTVSGGTCTATNTSAFKDGESFGAVGVVGVFASGAPRALTKVASAPGQDQYTVTSGGVYTFGGTAPTTAYITYNATPNGGRIATSDKQRVVSEWARSTAANYVSTVNGVDYGLPGLLYNRPYVRVADTFNALLDTSSGSLQLSKPGTMDILQLHGIGTAGYLTALAFKTLFDADYPSAPSLDQKPTRNNWYAARGTGAGTTFTGTLPPSMRAGFTGSNAPTLISVNGTVLGKVDTSSGAISGTGITSGSFNYATGDWTITFAAASSMPSNAQLWFEQDIGNFDYANMAEGTIGRNAVMNGLLDMTVAVGSNLTTTTGTSTVGGVANSAVPYGWTLGNAAMATAVTNTTATVAVAAETDSAGFPRFAMEAYGSHTASTALQLGQVFNNMTARVSAGDRIMSGGQLRYAKTAANGRTYGHTGLSLRTSMNTAAITRNTSAGLNTGILAIDHQVTDTATGVYMDDQLMDIAGGAVDLYRVTPLLDTAGSTFSGPQIFVNMNTGANVPFAYRLGIGRLQTRRRNDFAAA